MENPIHTQLLLLERAVRIINSQLSDIDTLGRSIELPDQLEDLKRKTLLQVKRRHLEFYSEIQTFLIEKLRTEPDKNFRFYIVHIRTILETYALLLFLLDQDENKQMAFCIANLLYTFTSGVRNPGLQDGQSEIAYRSYLSTFRPFLDRESINIPPSMKDFSRQRLRQMKLGYPPVEQMLNRKAIESYALGTMKVFPTVSTQIYKTYKDFSNYIHGNPISHVFQGKKRFWLLSQSAIIASLVIEPVNNRITRHSRKDAFDDGLRLLDESADSFVMVWKVYKP